MSPKCSLKEYVKTINSPGFHCTSCKASLVFISKSKAIDFLGVIGYIIVFLSTIIGILALIMSSRILGLEFAFLISFAVSLLFVFLFDYFFQNKFKEVKARFDKGP
jgi:hypothetical protein